MFINEPFGGIIPGAQGAALSVLLNTGTPLTGRQVYRLAGGPGLTAVQEALQALQQVGVVASIPAGRAHLHTVNEDHAAVPALRALANPREILRHVITDAVNDTVDAVVLFGSAARGGAGRTSDVDLAVLAPGNWGGRSELGRAVESRFGGSCDILVFTTEQFTALAQSGDEPVVRDIVRDGIALVGALPGRRPAQDRFAHAVN